MLTVITLNAILGKVHITAFNFINYFQMHHYSQRFCQVQGAVQRTVESRRVENRLCLQGPRWSAKELTRMGTYKHCVLRWKQEMG